MLHRPSIRLWVAIGCMSTALVTIAMAPLLAGGPSPLTGNDARLVMRTEAEPCHLPAQLLMKMANPMTILYPRFYSTIVSRPREYVLQVIYQKDWFTLTREQLLSPYPLD